MQLAKLVIASVLVFAACANGLPEGRDCLFNCTLDVRLVQRLHTLAVIIKLAAVRLQNFSVLISSLVIIGAKVNWEKFTWSQCHVLFKILKYLTCEMFDANCTLFCSWSSAQAPEEC